MMGSSSSDRSLFDLLAVAADPDRAKAFLEERAKLIKQNRAAAEEMRKATAEHDAARAKAEEAEAKLAAHSRALATSMDHLQDGVAALEKDRAAHEEAKASFQSEYAAQKNTLAHNTAVGIAEHAARMADLERREAEVAQAVRAHDTRAAILKANEDAMAERKAELAHRFTRLRDLVG